MNVIMVFNSACEGDAFEQFLHIGITNINCVVSTCLTLIVHVCKLVERLVFKKIPSSILRSQLYHIDFLMISFFYVSLSLERSYLII